MTDTLQTGNSSGRLLPCPFCGGAGEYRQEGMSDFIRCTVCHAQSAGAFDHHEAAAMLWNRRTTE